MEASSTGETPQSQEWFLATLITEISIEGETRNVVHRNLFLVSARSPEEAYHKALQIGHEGEITYDNPAGRQVRHSFRGVAQLEELVDGEPADGAELAFEQHVAVSEEEIQALVPPKERLRVFGETALCETNVPDYSSKDVLIRVAEMLSEERGEERETPETRDSVRNP
jgi:hypothetical protein